MANVLNRTTKQFLPSVNTPDYPVEDWIISPDMSGVDGVPTKYWHIDGDTVREKTQGEKDAVDADVLPAYKLAKEAEIDARSSELILAGLEFPPASGNILSFSVNAQTNLIGLKTALDDLTEPDDFPIEFSFKDNSNKYDCPNKATLNGMFLSGMVHKRVILDAGNALKTLVRAAATKAELDAVVDNR